MPTRETTAEPVVVLGGTGKTGRRVVRRLEQRGVETRVGSRTASPPFDWHDTSTWPPVLDGARAAYVAYHPDLAAPGAVATIAAFTDAARAGGLHRVVLLSGRGEDEARRAEDVLRRTDLDWTIVRSSWFNQNFTESFMLDMVTAGAVTLPAGDVPEPFVDADDIADVAVAALLDHGHAGQLYEVSGPRALTFGAAVEEIARSTGRDIRFVPVPLDSFTASLRDQGVPEGTVDLLAFLFGTVLDGRNARPTDGVQRALGRPPRDFRDFARDAAASGVWAPPEPVRAVR